MHETAFCQTKTAKNSEQSQNIRPYRSFRDGLAATGTAFTDWRICVVNRCSDPKSPIPPLPRLGRRFPSTVSLQGDQRYA